MLGLTVAGTGGLATVASGPAAAAVATTIQVPRDCSLVGALAAAQDGNARGECLGLAANLPAPFTIQIDPAAGPVVLNQPNNDTDGQNGLPAITGDVTIESATSALAVIERDPAAPAFRIFDVTPTGSLTLDHVKLAGGLAQGGAGADANAPGGGGAGMGGAIFSHDGSVVIRYSELTGNAAVGGRGGNTQPFVGLFGLSLSGFYGGGGGMGGPGQPGSLFAEFGDGGPPNGGSVTFTVTGGKLTVASATYNGGFGGGGLGAGDGGFGGGGGGVEFSGGGIGGFGGGGGATVFEGGTPTPSSSLFGGGIGAAAGGGGAGMGGAVFAYGGSLTITASTLSGNGATGGPGGQFFVAVSGLTAVGGGGGFGGGVFAYGDASSGSASVTIANATLAGNSASGQTFPGTSETVPGGGALYLYGAAVNSRLVNDTVALNGAPALITGAGASAYVGNTVLAASVPAGTGDVSGAVYSQGGNVVGNATGATGFLPADRSGTAAAVLDPRLGGLLANGGPTPTMALESGSPAIGAGIVSLCQDPPVGGLDQRGEPRPANICDAGAYQGSLAPAIASLTPVAGPPGTLVAIAGTSFGSVAGSVHFGSSVATETGWSDTGMTATVPSGLAGSVAVAVYAADGLDSTGAPFRVTAPDGSGTLGVSPSALTAGATGRTLTFTYTPVAGGLVDGTVLITVPSGWSPPSVVATDPGYATASAGSLSTSGDSIIVSGLTLSSPLTVTYGDTSGGGPGAAVQSGAGAAAFAASEASIASDRPAGLATPATVTVNAAPVAPLTVTTSALPAATVGQPYIDFLAATGGTAPYTWRVGAGALPAGLQLDGAQGVLYGTPTAAGPATVTLQVADTAGRTASSGALGLDVAPAQPANALRLTLNPELVTAGQTSVTAAVYNANGDALAGQTVDLATTGGSLNPSSIPGSVAGAVYAVTLSGLTATGPVTVTGSMGGLVAQAVAFVPPSGTSVTGVSEGDNTVAGGGLAVGGPGSGTPDLSAQATGGTGAVALVRDALGSDPAGPPTFDAGSGVYFDASLGAGSTYTALTVDACDLHGGTLAYWWTGRAWQTVSDAVYDPGSGCLTITVNGSTVPSLAELTGTPFAVGVTPAPSPGGGGSSTGGGSSSSSTAKTKVAASVGASGGTLATADGAFTLTLPAGSISGTATLGVTEACPPPAPAGIPSDTAVASCVFTLAGATLTAPATATIEYHVQALGGLPAGRLSVYRQDAGGGWSFLPTAVDAASGTVSVKVAGPVTLAVLADTQRFADVPAGYWAAPAIDTVVAASIADGFPGGTFQPDAALSRAEFVKMLDLAVGLKVAGGATAFADVPADAWFAPYVAAAVQAGIVDGTSATTFSPDATVTREQMAAMLARALKLSGTASLRFTDAGAIDGWALQGVEAAVAAGYLKGFPDGTFRPLALATRAQAAQVLAAVITGPQA